MGTVKMLRCISCGREFSPDEIEYTCPTCGPRRGTLEVIYDYDHLRRILTRDSFSSNCERTMWRYLPLLPVKGRRFIQPLRVGYTPLYSYPNLANHYGLNALWIKDDGQNPTASYKDRASAVVVIKAQEKKKRVVTCASTGNAASSLAGFSAATGLETIIFVPRTAPVAKVTQLLIYGARVFLVDGSYDVAYDLAAKAAEAFGWYNRSAAVNPYLVEGKKTGALELAEQLNWGVPDTVFVSVGDGSVISGICKGFDELARLGLIDQAPKVIGVQAAGAAPIAQAFARYNGNKVLFNDIQAETVADSICVGRPRDIVKAVTYLAKNGGEFITVTDQQITAAIATMARKTGIFPEPAGAAPFAGLLKLVDSGVLSGKSAAVMVTGNGLKDIATARKAAGAPIEIPPDLAALEEHL
ncbi:MAG: threonine synthase [Candidatus Bipolaricaulota bacterium]|nr:threonine synthase [Candidatus Bipolaricaulota bacterium]